MFGINSSKIVIVGTHGKGLGLHLKEHLHSKGIKTKTAGALNRKNKNTAQKIREASLIICINKEMKMLIEDSFELDEKHVICLDVSEMPESGSSKPLTGEAWLEYQETIVRPELRKQIKKHIKKLREYSSY